ncbi:hypothetical protein [Streptomyces ipomoeae]|uniref:hypothetical protein n=1 Tax=Streptomyces ipomoeae TaxID=103232 RepID=UPI00114628D5|nr:hypothetical protein [Streptomyces ipomoeae]TQE33141.1 hypothetical protein Sipo7851_21860 [Streptomyces ipomoeae]
MYEMRLTDPNGYTVPGAVRYKVPADQKDAVEAELKGLVEADAATQRQTYLDHAEQLTGPSKGNALAAANQFTATAYEVKATPVA